MFLQVRLWNDCINRCKFCSVDYNRTTPIESKIIRINKTISFIEDKNIDKFGLIGGEYFEGQLEGIESSFEILLETLYKSKISNLFITANLIHDQYKLDLLNPYKNKFTICTSYDTRDRFHTDNDKKNWIKNITKLLENGYKLHITSIITQDLIEDKNFDFIYKLCPNINLVEPHCGIQDLQYSLTLDPIEYHKHLISNNKFFKLPKRLDFLNWIIKYPNIITNYTNYSYNHSEDVISFDKNNNIVYELKNRLNSLNNWLASCNHPKTARCYIDSDNCLMCDVHQLI